MDGISRASTTYGVSTSAIRIAGRNDAPFRIINTSTDTPIWVSSLSGTSAGLGTPINPGTSLQWTSPDELYAVTASGTASVIITTDVDDWQPDPAAVAAAILNSGVLIIDKPVTLLSGAAAGGYTFDTSKYGSLFVTVTRNSLNAGTYSFIQFGMNKTGVLTPAWVRAIEMPPTPAFPAIWTASIPCIGDTLTVSNLGGANVTVIASFRAQESMTQTVQYWDANEAILKTVGFVQRVTPVNTSLPAGDNLFYTQPWFGDLDIGVMAAMVAGGAAVDKLVVSIQAYNKLSADWGYMRQVSAPLVSSAGVNYSTNVRIGCAGTMYRLIFTNNSAGAASFFNSQAIPVREDI